MRRKWKGKIFITAIVVLMALPFVAYGFMQQDKPQDQGQDKPQDQGQDKPQDQGQDKPQDQGQDKPQDQGQDKPQDQGQDKPKDQGQDKPKDQGQDKPKDQGQDKPKDQGQDKPKDKGRTQPSNSRGVAEKEQREPSVYEESMLRLKDISEELKKLEASLAEHSWLASTQVDVELLDKLYKKLEMAYGKFPTPEGWPVPGTGQRLESPAYQMRDKANAVMFEYVHFRSLLDSKSEAVRQKLMLEQLKSSSPPLDDFASYLEKRFLLFGGLLLLLLTGVGFLGYESLRRKIVFHGHGPEQRINQHESLLKDINQSLGELAKNLITEITSLIGKLSKDERIVAQDNNFEQQLRKEARSSPIDILVKQYNESLNNEQKIRDFRQRYHPKDIGLKNAEERAGNSKIVPVFGAADNGDFYAIKIEQNGHITYAVVPRFGFIFSEKKYTNAGLSHVFKCNADALRSQGNTIIVKQPARFEPDAQGEIWELQSQGEIDLEQG